MSSRGSHKSKFSTVVFLVMLSSAAVYSQTKEDTKGRAYPSSIRGYKLEKARVIVSRLRQESRASTGDAGYDAVIQIGNPAIQSVTPLGITFELPVSLSGINQGGHVDFLSFEDVVVNGTPVNIADYYSQFELTVKGTAELPAPIRVTVSLPRALLGALSEWSDQKLTWNVTARVYIFGRFRKFLMKFKRVVPVEIRTEIENPLRSTKHDAEP